MKMLSASPLVRVKRVKSVHSWCVVGIPAVGIQVNRFHFRRTTRAKPEASVCSEICLVVEGVAAGTWTLSDSQPAAEVRRVERYSHDLVPQGKGLGVKVSEHLAAHGVLAEEAKEASCGKTGHGGTEGLVECLDTNRC